MSDLPVMLRNKMKQDGYDVGRSEPYEMLRSSDGTEKYLFKTVDGGFVETVYIPDRDRATVCVSCQVGCKMNCLFCQTGKQGFHGNLTVSDILNQIFSLENSDKVTNVVFMGQGEPFDNLDNVMSVLDVLTSSWGVAWSPKRITVSTVGLKKNLKRFLDESDCHLAISLHTPYHKQRLELMPAERQFTIEEIVNLLRGYDFSHQRRLSFEYIMFSGLNDDITAAKELVKLLHGLECRVNLIRFHKIPNVELYGCEHETMIRFRDYLTNHGVFTTIRASRGEDIFAACGLLSTAKIINNIS
jgi:23S rRNA (adenine2503-C2)-methyltransferase